MASEDVMIWEPNEREQEWLNNHRKIRSYEVSIWTLQDDFITVLKHANIENKGQIQNGKLIIKDDGTEELTFTIPMYLYDQQKNILGENPIWYNTINGNIAVDMRKIKLIFNKGSDAEKVYEFLIVKVNERHVKDELFCDVSCEGLAFHELGKIGYKISLSAEDVNRDVEQWEEEDPEIKIKNEDQILVYKYKGNTPEERLEAYKAAYPLATLQYWLNKFLLPEPEEDSNEEVSSNKWYYKVEMNYDAFEDRQNRNSSIVYEESYPASWDTTDDKKITVVRVEPYKEKARLVDLEESNIYNLTQNLAETFEIFCRYEYSHDLNYHITGRKIIFYNNFIYDNESFIDFTYPYSTSEITREMDSTDLITKMFVRSIEDDTTASGLLTIIDTAANKTGEDYLLNFDYLYDIKAISEEQYKTVSSYEATMKKLNLEIAPLESQIIALSARIPDLEAKVTIAKNAIQLDTDRISAAKDLFDALTEGDGEIEITPDSPDTAILLEDDKNAGSYFIRLSKHGIDASSIRIFRNFNIGQIEWYATEVINGEANGRLYNELKTGQIEYDEFGDVVRVRNLYIEDNEDRKLVFVVYNYTPKLYYDRVVQTWTLRLEKDQTDKNRYEAELKQVNARLQEVQEAYNERIAEKQKEIKKFEAAMGPALREGYWAPDDYKDCGDNYIDDFIISTVYQYGEDEVNQYNHQPKQDDTEKQTLLDSFLWDTELFSDEFDCKHEVGANQAPELYPCIDLSEFISSLINDSTITEEEYKRRIENLSFFFYDLNGSNSYEATLDPGQMRSFSVGSQCQYGFIKKDNEVIPVLILNGVNTLPETITIKRTVTNQNADGEQTEYNIESTTVNTLSFLKTKPMFLGALKVDTEHNKVLTFDWSYRIKITNQIDDSNDWIDGPYETVYPRIKIDSLAVKTSSDQLYVGYNKQKLENIKDYYSFSRLAKEELFNEEFSADNTKLASYYITIKPETILKLGGLGKNLNIKYIISNADTAIYLDSKKVLKENAYPKVAYTIKLSILNREFMYDAYRRLCYITHINDAELKFQNVMGYISQMELNLDKPWEDAIEVKNYKTKFEDLFSTILASTEQMKKTGYVMQSAAAAFDAYGSIRPWALEGTIYKADLDYAFNNGKLTIDEKNGIWGVSESGVVAIRGGGIFTSTENDGKGNWKWNTGITPEGINATLITAGQLDTNRVMVYAGDKLRFQLNGQGLFAYKSFFEDIDTINEWIKQGKTNGYTVRDVGINLINDKLNKDEDSDLDASQFVKMDSNGLFLIVKENALVLNNDHSDYISIGKRLFKWLDVDGNSIPSFVPEDGIQRVSISWDGLTLRNYYNQKVLYADADSGNLSVKGSIFANEIKIGGEDVDTALSLNEYFGNPDALIVEGLTQTNISKLWGDTGNNSITIYYTTESDLINYLNGDNNYKQGQAGDIWYNTRAPEKDLTIFRIKSVTNPIKKQIKLGDKLSDEVDADRYDYWQVQQIESGQDADYSLTKALLGIFQSNITGTKYSTIYKALPKGTDGHPGQRHPAPIIEEVSRLVIVDAEGQKSYYPSNVTTTITWDSDQASEYQNKNYLDSEGAQFKIETYQVETSFNDKYEPIPLEDQEPDINIDKDNLCYGDIWINIDELGNLNGIYRWESDYQVTDTLLVQESYIIGNEKSDQSSNETNDSQENPIVEGKWVLISGISGITTEDGYLYDLTAAEGKVARIAHGEYGLIFTDSKKITDIQLNKRVGLQIKSGIKPDENDGSRDYNDGAYFRVNSSQFGFVSQYKDKNGYSIPYLYYEDGNLFIMGTIFAKNFYVIDKPGGHRTDLDSYMNFKFEDHVKVSDTLKKIFGEAGQILQAAGRSITDVSQLVTDNFAVLASFKDNVITSLTPNITRGPSHIALFKPGDIWEVAPEENSLDSEVTATYIAIAYWSEIYKTETEAKSSTALSSTKGWSRTSDYSLAAITGADYKADAEAGTFDIWAGHALTLKSAGTIYLGADKKIDIVGNQEVNIGGKYINIGTAEVVDKTDSSRNTATTNMTSGIRLVTSSVIKKTINTDGTITDEAVLPPDNIGLYDETTEGSTSKVYILPTGIEMASKNGIQIKSGAGITIKSSTNSNVSVIDIDNSKGIWLGSSQKIDLFSGDLSTYEASGSATGAAVEISPARILMGVSNLTTGGTTAVDITESNIIFGAGIVSKVNGIGDNGIITDTSDSHGSNSTSPYDQLKDTPSIVGVVISKDAIGMATGVTTGNVDTRNLILLDDNGIILGQAQAVNDARSYNNISGSFVNISTSGIRIGSSSNLYIRTSNVFLDDSTNLTTGRTGTGFGLGYGVKDWSKWKDNENKVSGETDTEYSKWGLVFDGHNLHIKGHVYAQGLYIHDLNDPAESGIAWNAYFSNLFNIAADIIGDIHNSAEKFQEETSLNKVILGNFQNKIYNRLSVKTYTGSRTADSGWDFKPGDYWVISNDGTYLAMAYWYEIYANESTAKESGALSSKAGWTKVNSDKVPNTLIGATMYTDADAGIISMWANSGIHLFSDNRTANNGTVQTTTGTSAVDITPAGIVLAATKKIELGVNGTVTSTSGGASTQSGFSGIKISDTELFLGSNTKISLFSSNSATSTAASMTISPNEILFGVAGTSATSVVDITTDKIIMGSVADVTSGIETFTITSSGTTYSITSAPTAGLRITSSSIGLVASQNSIILLDSDGIGVGSRNSTSGAFSGIIIRPHDLVMTTSGKVQLYGSTGEIVFGPSKDTPYFKVTPEGDVYCRRLYAEEGIGTGAESNPSSSPIWTGSVSYNITSTTPELERYTDIGSSAIRLPDVAKYTIVLTISADSDYSAYFQHATVWLRTNSRAAVGSASASFPIYSGGSKEVVYEVTGDKTVSALQFYGKIEQGTFSGTISAAIYRDFKGSSTSSSVQEAQQSQGSDASYTLIDTYSDRTLLELRSGWNRPSELADSNGQYPQPTFVVWRETTKSDNTKEYAKVVKARLLTALDGNTYCITESSLNSLTPADPMHLFEFKKGNWSSGILNFLVKKQAGTSPTYENTGLNITLSGIWSSGTYTVYDNTNTNTGLSTSLSSTYSSWDNGTYTVRYGSNQSTGFTITPTISLDRRTASTKTDLAGTIISDDNNPYYYPITLDGVSTGKYIKVNPNNTKTVNKVSITSIPSDNVDLTTPNSSITKSIVFYNGGSYTNNIDTAIDLATWIKQILENCRGTDADSSETKEITLQTKSINSKYYTEVVITFDDDSTTSFKLPVRIWTNDTKRRWTRAQNDGWYQIS